MKIQKILFFMMISLWPAWATAQDFSNIDPQDESSLRARTKQLTQFIRRFNAEEGPNGQKYLASHEKYRSPSLRAQYMPYLFDKQTDNFTRQTRNAFMEAVLDTNSPAYLDFHGPDWFAELNLKVTFNGAPQDLIVYMKLEKENEGYKWAIKNVLFEPFSKLFQAQTGEKEFIHPMSHEVEFMNLKKILSNQEKLQQYAYSGYSPDYLTLFFYEMKRGNMKFDQVQSLKFHFFQVDGWYFELSNVRRRGKNAGWLVTNLLEIDPAQKSKYIHLIQNGN